MVETWAPIGRVGDDKGGAMKTEKRRDFCRGQKWPFCAHQPLQRMLAMIAATANQRQSGISRGRELGGGEITW